MTEVTVLNDFGVPKNKVSNCFHCFPIYLPWSDGKVKVKLRPRGLQPARLLCLWDFPDKNTGVGCHFLLQGIFSTQGSNPGLPHCRQTLYHLSHHDLSRAKGSLVFEGEFGYLDTFLISSIFKSSRGSSSHSPFNIVGWAQRDITAPAELLGDQMSQGKANLGVPTLKNRYFQICVLEVLVLEPNYRRCLPILWDLFCIIRNI